MDVSIFIERYFELNGVKFPSLPSPIGGRITRSSLVELSSVTERSRSDHIRTVLSSDAVARMVCFASVAILRIIAVCIPVSKRSIGLSLVCASCADSGRCLVSSVRLSRVIWLGHKLEI